MGKQYGHIRLKGPFLSISVWPFWRTRATEYWAIVDSQPTSQAKDLIVNSSLLKELVTFGASTVAYFKRGTWYFWKALDNLKGTGASFFSALLKITWIEEGKALCDWYWINNIYAVSHKVSESWSNRTNLFDLQDLNTYSEEKVSGSLSTQTTNQDQWF